MWQLERAYVADLVERGIDEGRMRGLGRYVCLPQHAPGLCLLNATCPRLMSAYRDDFTLVRARNRRDKQT